MNMIQYDPKFGKGDCLISTMNPRLTYHVLDVGRPNEIGGLDYEVQTYVDCNPWYKTHLIACDKLDKWAKEL